MVEALIEFLKAKELLLVLDNCEHLIEPVATLVETLERSCPHLCVLSTSREGLGIEGELILAVPSLAAPVESADVDAVASSAAVQLFVERAQAVNEGFQLTPANAAEVAQLCRRLDGVPLAIELAAARIPTMNPAELVRRLDRRFDVLAGGRRGAVERHQTLRAAIDWSYDLLDEPQRRLLSRLAVFAGGCTLAAAEAVCGGDPVDEPEIWGLLASLVAQSLLVATDDGLDTRYHLLETIRQYGEERLDEYGETAWMRQRHRQYYSELGPTLWERAFGPEQEKWLNRLNAEQDNLLRAMHSALDSGDVDVAVRLFCGLPPPGMQAAGYGFHFATGPVLELPGAEDHPEYPLALAMASMKAAFRGERDAAEDYAELALDEERRLATHPDGQVDSQVLRTRTLIALSSGQWRDAIDYAERAASMDGAARPELAVLSLTAAAGAHMFAGDPDAAVAFATDAVALAQEIGMPRLIGQAKGALANALADRDPGRARALLREGHDLAAIHSEDTPTLVQTTFAAARLRDRRLTLDLAARALPRLHWNGDQPLLAAVLNLVAWALRGVEPETAAVLQGSARHLALAITSNPRAGLSKEGDGSADTRGFIGDMRREATVRLASVLGDERLRELRAQGEAMDPDEVVRCAIACCSQIYQWN
jgi:predicted ATPase